MGDFHLNIESLEADINQVSEAEPEMEDVLEEIANILQILVGHLQELDKLLAIAREQINDAEKQ